MSRVSTVFLYNRPLGIAEKNETCEAGVILVISARYIGVSLDLLIGRLCR